MTFASMSSISSTRSISSETAAVSVYSPPQFGPRRGYFADTSKNSDAWTEATCGRRQNVDMGGSFPRWIGGATMSTIASERRMRRFGGPVQRAQPISGEVKRGAVSALSAVAPSSLSAALVWAKQNRQSYRKLRPPRRRQSLPHPRPTHHRLRRFRTGSRRWSPGSIGSSVIRRRRTEPRASLASPSPSIQMATS